MKKRKKCFLIFGCLCMIILIVVFMFRKTYSLDNTNIEYGYEINGDNYLKIDENIGVINGSIILVSETSIDDFINNFSSNGNIGVYDVENNLLETGKLKTGNKLRVDFTNELLEYKISVIGDLTGDGIIDRNDVAKLSKHILNLNILNNEYLYAGDIDINNIININDVIKLVKAFNGNVSDDEDDGENISGISFEKDYEEIYLNSSSTDLALTLNISPSSAVNKNVIWTSSNNEIATISSDGVVTPKKLGVVNITATTEDGNFQASMNVAVKKKIVVIIGASQVTRMAQYKKSYNSSNYNYNVTDETLIYVDKSGSGIEYQYTDGFTKALEYINGYENDKNMVDFYIYFPLSGNSILKFVCGSQSNTSSLGTISSDNSKIGEYVENYNNVIKNVNDMGYNVVGYVVSMHPVRVSQASSGSYVVYNENSNACKYQYRSNWKYYLFNNAVEEIINNEYTNTLNYISLFPSIMETNDEMKNFSYKITYNTTDGVHWDSDTTNMYVNMMLEYSGKL